MAAGLTTVSRDVSTLALKIGFPAAPAAQAARAAATNMSVRQNPTGTNERSNGQGAFFWLERIYKQLVQPLTLLPGGREAHGMPLRDPRGPPSHARMLLRRQTATACDGSTCRRRRRTRECFIGKLQLGGRLLVAPRATIRPTVTWITRGIAERNDGRQRNSYEGRAT